jgi:hypothetical protein
MFIGDGIHKIGCGCITATTVIFGDGLYATGLGRENK